jgi:type I restriction enzyme S subunit
VCSDYLRWALYSLHRQSAIWRYQQQTTGIINLKVADYLNHKIETPPLPQQRRIAEILSTLDEAIEQTEALIAKHQQIKAGLMHDLFTRGVTPDGHLRPTREQGPDHYKDSPLGWIPKEWQCELLDDLAVRGSGHTPNKNFPEYWNGGVKWISLADSYRLDRLYITDTEYEISQLGIQNSSAVMHPTGTVVLSRDAGVGKSAITTEPMAVSQHFMCWRCDDRLNKHFLYYWLQFKKRMFENIAMGSTILTIGLPYFKRLRVAAPANTEEQKMVGDCLQSVDKTIFSLEADLEKKKQQKHGLMHDLLTGRVPVNINESGGVQ